MTKEEYLKIGFSSDIRNPKDRRIFRLLDFKNSIFIPSSASFF